MKTAMAMILMEPAASADPSAEACPAVAVLDRGSCRPRRLEKSLLGRFDRVEPVLEAGGQGAIRDQRCEILDLWSRGMVGVKRVGQLAQILDLREAFVDRLLERPDAGLGGVDRRRHERRPEEHRDRPNSDGGHLPLLTEELRDLG